MLPRNHHFCETDLFCSREMNFIVVFISVYCYRVLLILYLYCCTLSSVHCIPCHIFGRGFYLNYCIPPSGISKLRNLGHAVRTEIWRIGSGAEMPSRSARRDPAECRLFRKTPNARCWTQCRIPSRNQRWCQTAPDFQAKEKHRWCRWAVFGFF